MFFACLSPYGWAQRGIGRAFTFGLFSFAGGIHSCPSYLSYLAVDSLHSFLSLSLVSRSLSLSLFYYSLRSGVSCHTLPSFWIWISNAVVTTLCYVFRCDDTPLRSLAGSGYLGGAWDGRGPDEDGGGLCGSSLPKEGKELGWDEAGSFGDTRMTWWF